MKKLSVFITTALLATSTLVYAGQNHEHNDSGKAQTMQPGAMGESGNMGMMMSGDMQSHMTKMQTGMMAIHKETDPAKRKAMMDTHMKDMKSMMEMMKNRRAMMQSKQMDQMKQLSNRMTMMEGMMEQMLNSQMVTQGTKVSEPKK